MDFRRYVDHSEMRGNRRGCGGGANGVDLLCLAGLPGTVAAAAGRESRASYG